MIETKQFFQETWLRRARIIEQRIYEALIFLKGRTKEILSHIRSMCVHKQ